MSAFDLLEVACANGLGVIQFADNLPLNPLTDAEQVTLKQDADAKGIRIELGTQSFNIGEVLRDLSIAARLDAKILRVALDGPDAAKSVAALADEFRQVLPAAKAAGVRIAIENHFNFPSRRMVDLLNVLADDQVGVCLDVANSICAGEWPMETVSILADHTINLHLKDYVIVPDPYGVGFRIHGCPLGQGRADCRAILEVLPRRDMTVVMEHWLPQADDMAAARAAEGAWLEQSLTYARDELGLDG